MAGNKRILVVDDDAMSLRMAVFILKKTDYEIIPAKSGEEGIECLKERQADLLLLDVEMPGKDGIETLREIRAMEPYRTVPVIFFTGTIDEERRQQAKELGTEHFALKPLKPQELLDQIEQVLQE